MDLFKKKSGKQADTKKSQGKTSKSTGKQKSQSKSGGGEAKTTVKKSDQPKKIKIKKEPFKLMSLDDIEALFEKKT